MPNPAGDTPGNYRAIFIGGAAVLVVGGVVAYALFQRPPEPIAAAQGLTTAATPAPFPALQLAHAAPAPSAAAAVSAASPQPDATGSPAWQATIDNVLKSNVDPAQMAQILINLLPTLPEDGQIEAANHISNLLPDAQYNSIRPLLMNPNLPEAVQGVFFTDLMNRGDDTKLHAFLDIAQMPNHPFHDEALSDLQIYVGDDYGTDWTKWNSAVTQYLKAAGAP